MEAEDVRLQLSEDVVTDGLADEDRIVLAGSDLSIECRFNVSISQHNASRIRWDIVRHFDDKSRQVSYFFFTNSYGTSSKQLYICVFQYKKVSGPC